jgi:hypothetical protein
MIETSTPTTNSLQNDMAQNNATEDLGEEEQSFYDSIKKNLNTIVRTPGQDVIARILKYSKSV